MGRFDRFRVWFVRRLEAVDVTGPRMVSGGAGALSWSRMSCWIVSGALCEAWAIKLTAHVHAISKDAVSIRRRSFIKNRNVQWGFN